MTHKFFRYPRTVEDCVGDLEAIAEWARIGYGWLGRSPDYKAAFLATLGANADFYEPYQDNARRWYREAQERVLYWNHAIIHPPVDRNRPPEEVSDVFMHVEEERDDGIVVSGAKVVATGRRSRTTTSSPTTARSRCRRRSTRSSARSRWTRRA